MQHFIDAMNKTVMIVRHAKKPANGRPVKDMLRLLVLYMINEQQLEGVRNFFQVALPFKSHFSLVAVLSYKISALSGGITKGCIILCNIAVTGNEDDNTLTNAFACNDGLVTTNNVEFCCEYFIDSPKDRDNEKVILNI